MSLISLKVFLDSQPEVHGIHSLLRLGEYQHMYQRVTVLVSVCLCVSVTNLAMGSFISALKSNHTIVALVAVVLSSL